MYRVRLYEKATQEAFIAVINYVIVVWMINIATHTKSTIIVKLKFNIVQVEIML